MYFSTLLLLSFVVILCSATQSDHDLFHDFVVKYKKTYFQIGDRNEYDHRFKIFSSNLRLIEQENAKNSGFTLGITQFADLTNDEFRAAKKGSFKAPSHITPQMTIKALPTSFNWVNQGKVGSVEDEGDCGSSFVFTVTESIASVYSISANKTYEALSTDQIAACTSTGCSGGDSSDVLKYVEAHGIEFADTYQNGSCPKGRVANGVCIKSSTCVPSGNEDALAAALISQGPLFVAIDGSSTSFEMYTSGIYAPSNCSPTQLDTSLLLVGFNQHAWIAQNQWGTDWGMDGYIWIARGNNTCGIATAGCYPTGVTKC